MSDHHTFFGKLIAGVFSIFKSSAQKIWDGLSDEEKASVKNGSGIIAVINAHISEAPEIIKDEVIAAYPNEPDIEAKLLALCAAFGITPPTLDLTSAIASIQTFLATKDGTLWQWASSALAQALSVIFTPDLTVFAKITTVMEYAYQTFIKK